MAESPWLVISLRCNVGFRLWVGKDWSSSWCGTAKLLLLRGFCHENMKILFSQCYLSGYSNKAKSLSFRDESEKEANPGTTLEGLQHRPFMWDCKRSAKRRSVLKEEFFLEIFFSGTKLKVLGWGSSESYLCKWDSGGNGRKTTGRVYVGIGAPKERGRLQKIKRNKYSPLKPFSSGLWQVFGLDFVSKVLQSLLVDYIVHL